MISSNRIVTVKRKDVLEKLKANRKDHKREYFVALAAYKVKMARQLKKELKRLEKTPEDETYNVSVSIPVPQHHLDEYDTMIEVLTWETDDEVDFDMQEFQNFVLDKWHWKESWNQTVSTYFTSVVGPTGPTGPTGARGPTGPEGKLVIPTTAEDDLKKLLDEEF